MNPQPPLARTRLLDRLTGWPPLLRLRDIIMYSDLEFSELGTAWAALSWGIWLTMPWTYADPQHPVAVSLVAIAPLSAWALASILIGSLQLLGLAWARPTMRMAGSLTAFLLWMFIALLFLGINASSPHAPAYGALALMAGWAHLRVSLTSA
jgi:hypothetical protein